LGLTQEFAELLSTISYDTLPASVLERTKLAMLDFLGLAARGSRVESTLVVRRWVSQATTGGPATVIGTGERRPAEYAALLNGAAAHSLELDDIHNGASLHPGVVIFPTALAVASVFPCEGKKFLAAVVAGYETMARLGETLQPQVHYARGFHPTATCGVFGAAVTAAKIMDLPVAGLVTAMGIAGSQAAGSHEYHAGGGTWTKRFHPGWAAHSGIIAAGLAKAGFRAPTTILEGRDGFLHAYSGDPVPERLLDGFGKPYAIMATGMKPYACCRYKQGGIDGILEIVRRHNLKPEDIKSIRVGLVGPAIPIIAEPSAVKQNPRHVADAQFSMPFGAAVAAVFRRASLSEYTENVLGDPRVQDMMQRVTCYHAPDLDASYPRLWPTRVEIETFFGLRDSVRLDTPKGDPENPLTKEEVEDKFSSTCEIVWGLEQRRSIVETVYRLDALENLEDLQSLLHGPDVSNI